MAQTARLLILTTDLEKTIKGLVMSMQIARQEQIKPILAAAQRQIASLLDDTAKAKRFMAAGLLVASDPALNKCTPESIVQALIGVAMSDLNIDKNIGHCYLVPYRDSVQLQIGYKGMIQLLFRAGWLVKCFPVYKCDRFTMSCDGWDNKVVFEPEIDLRDEGDKDWVFENLRGIYVVARHSDTKDEASLFVSKAVIEKLRKNSQNQRASQWSKPEDKKRLDAGLPIGIWGDWYQEMAQGKAVKKLAKILPIGDSRAVAMALVADDKNESGKAVDYRASNEAGIIIESSVSEPAQDAIVLEILSAVTIGELDAIKPKLKASNDKEAQAAWIKRAEEISANSAPQDSIADEINEAG